MLPSLRRLALAMALGTALAPAASACPNCKEALSAQPSDASRLADAFSWSIILMLGVPMGIVSVGGLAVRHAVKRGILPEM